MDNITHSLVGLALSRAGINRWCKHASWILFLAANTPDLDVISALGGSVTYLRYHRGVTHSLLLLPVMALAPVLTVGLFARRNMTWKRAWAASAIGVLSHLLLDWTNIYGVRLLAPVSAEWFRLDLANVIDFWIWSLLALSVVAPAISRLVSSEIGAKSTRGRGAAIFALACIVLYYGGRYVMHQRAVNVLDSRIYEGAAPVRVAALPTFANPFSWEGLVEGSSFYSMYRLNLLEEFDPGSGEIYYKSEPGAPGEAARKTEAFLVFLGFSQYPLWRVTPLDRPQDASKVEVIDLRFGAPSEMRFRATAVVDAHLSVLNSNFTFGPFH